MPRFEKTVHRGLGTEPLWSEASKTQSKLACRIQVNSATINLWRLSFLDELDNLQINDPSPRKYSWVPRLVESRKRRSYQFQAQSSQTEICMNR